MNNTENSIGIWISVLYRYRKSYMSKKLEKYGIIGGLYMIIMVLYKYGGSSQERISDYLKVDKTTTARSVKKLEKEGYVKRETNSVDKRAYKVYLTQKALNIIPEIQKAVKEWDQMIISGITDESYQIMERLLSKMAENACNYIDSDKNDKIGEEETE